MIPYDRIHDQNIIVNGNLIRSRLVMRPLLKDYVSMTSETKTSNKKYLKTNLVNQCFKKNYGRS